MLNIVLITIVHYTERDQDFDYTNCTKRLTMEWEHQLSWQQLSYDIEITVEYVKACTTFMLTRQKSVKLSYRINYN